MITGESEHENTEYQEKSLVEWGNFDCTDFNRAMIKTSPSDITMCILAFSFCSIWLSLGELEWTNMHREDLTLVLFLNQYHSCRVIMLVVWAFSITWNKQLQRFHYVHFWDMIKREKWFTIYYRWQITNIRTWSTLKRSQTGRVNFDHTDFSEIQLKHLQLKQNVPFCIFVFGSIWHSLSDVSWTR